MSRLSLQNRWEKSVTIAGCILLPVFLLLLSYQVNLLLASLSPEQERIFQFLEGRAEDLGTDYTPAEVSHLRDVQDVMRGADTVWYSLLGIVLLMGLAISYYKLSLQRILRYASLSSIITLGIFILFLVVSFNLSFTAFHLLLFPQGNWQFPADSMLIKTFPLDFFMGLGTRIVGGAMLLGFVAFLLSLITKYGFTLCSCNPQRWNNHGPETKR